MSSTITPTSLGSGKYAPRSSTMTTSADALRDEEVGRTRAFLKVGWVVALGVIVAVLATPGNRTIATILLSLVGVGVLGSVWLYYQLRDVAKFEQGRLSVLAFICVLCGQLGLMYVGVFTAAPLITVLGLYFFCRTENHIAAIAMFIISAGGHAVEATLIIGNVIPDPGFYAARPTSIEAQISGQFCIMGGYVISFVMARLGRRASLQAIDELQLATRLAAQREEQVHELRQDLDRALKIGGPGRFTGHVVGAWELGPVLGRGAMGEVYEATHTKTGDAAAVKLLRRELLGARDYVERFLREVRAASSLESPHVVRVLDASTPEDPIPFLAMERLRGQSLGDLLRKKAQLPRQRLLQLATQIASVLEQAAAIGIVHRDVKPHNLFLDESKGDQGFWKLLDFGVAHLGESSGTLTQGAVIGTPTYMAPEQAKGQAVDPRADVYALAAVLYRAMTGQVPFIGRDTPALLYAVVHTMPIRPGAIASVPPQLEAVLAIGLAKSRDQRFQTATELAAAVDAADRGELAPELRARAKALLRVNPWNEPISEETKELPSPAR